MIRPTVPADVAALKAVIEANNLFPPQMLDGMLVDYFAGGREQFWLTDDQGGTAVGLAYYAPERMTEGTWNLYLIAVRTDQQRQGRGSALIRHVERTLSERGGRILLVETSGLEQFEPARAFYRRCGYEPEARVRDFYAAGEDKVIFRKALADAGKKIT